jgi:signal transduction histidine kinase
VYRAASTGPRALASPLRRGARAVVHWARRGPSGSLLGTVHLLIAVLVVLLVSTVAATGLARMTVASAEHELADRVLPARQAARDIAKAYVDQETGQRGFLLTGDPTLLEPYESGQDQAGQLREQLGRLLADDPAGQDLLRALDDAAAAWTGQVAEPEIAARRAGPVALDQLSAMAMAGEPLFDQLRARLGALQQHTADLTTDQLARISRAQHVANVVALSVAVLALLVVAGAIPLLRHLISKPLGRLLGQVQAVAGGAYGQPISESNPQELAAIARSVDRMRDSIVTHAHDLVAAQRELTLSEEHDRLATELHDTSIQRIFALGLALSSLARRNPELEPTLSPLIQETDQIVREIRTVIFDLGREEGTEGLRAHVADLAGESVRALGFTPTVAFSGPVDGDAVEHLEPELLAVLREMLSNVAAHAHATRAGIELAVEDGWVRVGVTDDGVGIGPAPEAGYGLTSMRRRAARLGGTAELRPGPDGTGTVAEWRVPTRAR